MPGGVPDTGVPSPWGPRRCRGPALRSPAPRWPLPALTAGLLFAGELEQSRDKHPGCASCSGPSQLPCRSEGPLPAAPGPSEARGGGLPARLNFAGSWLTHCSHRHAPDGADGGGEGASLSGHHQSFRSQGGAGARCPGRRSSASHTEGHTELSLSGAAGHARELACRLGWLPLRPLS